MKQRKPQPTAHDPWQALVRDTTFTAVPLEQVLASLRVSEREAHAVKQGLLAQVTQLCEEPATDSRQLTADG